MPLSLVSTCMLEECTGHAPCSAQAMLLVLALGGFMVSIL